MPSSVSGPWVASVNRGAKLCPGRPCILAVGGGGGEREGRSASRLAGRAEHDGQAVSQGALKAEPLGVLIVAGFMLSVAGRWWV